MDSATSLRAFVIGPDQARVDSAARRLQARGIRCETSLATTSALRRASLPSFDLVVAVEVAGSWQPTRRLLSWDALEASAEPPPVLVIAEGARAAERADELSAPTTAVWDWVDAEADDREIAARARRLGRVCRSRRRLEELERRLAGLESIDPLTGLLNHRGFQSALAREFRRAQRYGASLSLLLCDLDRFRSLNEALGHALGDRVLQEIARSLRGQVRAVDVAARFGGDEFSLLLPQTDAEGARRVADRVRAGISDLDRTLRGQPGSDAAWEESGRLSTSIGLAVHPGELTATPGSFLAEAQRALARAKQDGRNRTTAAAEAGEGTTAEGPAAPGGSQEPSAWWSR